MASNPQDSPDQMDSAPNRSASIANEAALFQSPAESDVTLTAIFTVETRPPGIPLIACS